VLSLLFELKTKNTNKSLIPPGFISQTLISPDCERGPLFYS
jgi:hypothetical protein